MSVTMHIEVDSHTHTIASGHAYSTLMENVTAASQQCLQLLAITDHGPAMPGAPHIWFFANLRVVPKTMHGVTILRGVEANIIDYEGNIDIEEPVLGSLDIILASLHEPVISPSSRAAHTDTLIKTMATGKVDILAHAGNPAFPIDIDEVARNAAYYNVAIEINNSSFTTSRPGSKKNCAALARTVAKHNGQITFGSDAHIASLVGKFDQCISLVESIDFPHNQILSSSEQRFLQFLDDRRVL